jgi:hypothetical protein
MGQEKSAVGRLATFTHGAQFFHNTNLLLAMSIFLIFIGINERTFCLEDAKIILRQCPAC